MTDPICITIKLFGALRNYSANENEQAIKLTFSKNCSLSEVVQALRLYIQSHFSHDHDDVIKSSVFADETRVLPKNIVFAQDTVIAILPPVCGG
jgi:molybdopterin converting factor small subunit